MISLAGSLGLAVRLVGAGWVWSLASETPAGRPEDRSFWIRLGRTVALGVLLNLLPALFLASWQAWSPAMDWSLWAGIVVAGLLRLKHSGGWSRQAATPALSALLLVWAVTSLALIGPPRSEWLAGGWDPGIYQNHSVVIAREGGIQPRTDSVYSLLTPEERELFTRSAGDYHEVLPAVPIRIEDGSLPLYFFHLTPVCGAWFARMGGLDLLFRLPAILALWGLFPLLALASMAGMEGPRKWVVLGCWLLSPLWWYHQAIPTTEMLYLLLLLGGALLYAHAARRNAQIPLGAMAAVFAATVNHLNAAVLMSALLLVAVLAEGRALLSGRLRRILLTFAAMGLAIAWNARHAAITILRLEEKDDAMGIILTLFAVAAILAPVLAAGPFPARIWKVIRRAAAIAGVAGGLLVAAVALGVSIESVRTALLQFTRQAPLIGTPLAYFIRVVSFHGVLGPAWAGLGLAWLAGSSNAAMRRRRLPAFGLGLVCLIVFLRPGIAPIYPWALRRAVVFWVPLLAWGQAVALVAVLEWMQTRRGRWRWLLPALFLPAVIEGVGQTVPARRVGDYNGFSSLLAFLEQSVAPGDVVVSDDPRWGTPLLLAGGRDVLNGQALRNAPEPEARQAILDVLSRLRAEHGRRILWLTSTDRERSIYPVEIGGAPVPDGEFTYTYRTVNHSSRARSFQTKEHRRTLRLFEWDGTYALLSPDADGSTDLE